MGIFYGDIHYGIQISKKINNNDQIFEEIIYEIKFIDKSITLDKYLGYVKIIFLYLFKPENYQYKLYADVITTHNCVENKKGWQVISQEQMFNFIGRKYKIDYLDE